MCTHVHATEHVHLRVNDDITRMQGFHTQPYLAQHKGMHTSKARGLDQTQLVQVGGECIQLSPWLRSLHLWLFSCVCLQEPHSLQYLNFNVIK